MASSRGSENLPPTFFSRSPRDEAASSHGVDQSVIVVGSRKDITHKSAVGRQARSVDPLACEALSSISCVRGMRGSGWRGRGTLSRSTRVHTLQSASELSSNWVGELVGSKFACVLCQHVIVVVRILSTSKSELRTFRARSRHPVPWPFSTSRARESRRLAQQGHLARPSEALTPCLVEEPTSSADHDPGLPPTAFHAAGKL